MTEPLTKSRLASWFRQWQVPLRRFLAQKGMVPAAELDDVAQEVFLRLLRYQKSELVEHPQAYLYKMASNVAAEWAIRSRNRWPHRAGWLENLPAQAQPVEELMNMETQSQLLQAIGTLAARQRELLKLHFVHGLTQNDIAARLGISSRMVKRQIIKSYAKLRDQMDDSWIERVPHGRQ